MKRLVNSGKIEFELMQQNCLGKNYRLSIIRNRIGIMRDVDVESFEFMQNTDIKGFMKEENYPGCS